MYVCVFYMHICICIYIYIHTYIYIYICIYIYTNVHICVFCCTACRKAAGGMYVCAFVCCVCTYTHIHVYQCVYEFMYICIHIHTYTYMYTFKYTNLQRTYIQVSQRYSYLSTRAHTETHADIHMCIHKKRTDILDVRNVCAIYNPHTYTHTHTCAAHARNAFHFGANPRHLAAAVCVAHSARSCIPDNMYLFSDTLCR